MRAKHRDGPIRRRSDRIEGSDVWAKPVPGWTGVVRPGKVEAGVGPKGHPLFRDFSGQ